MNQSRQQSFQKLRTPCVELSSTALKFKANQVSPKAVFLALEPVLQALDSLGQQDLLDEKLAEYAFFPITHILNQSRRLPSQVLEITVKCVQILVSKGWKDKLVPELGKQLLILMGLLVSSDPTQQSEPATDELKVATFDCMSLLLHQIARLDNASGLLDQVNARTIVDQIVYQLLEEMATTSSEVVQLSAAHTLLEMQSAVKSTVLLASLLPRTISTLVKVLRPSTQARRTQKVLATYLRLFTELVKKVLADDVLSLPVPREPKSQSLEAGPSEQATILDKSWLDATAPQIDIALIQVVKLRNQKSPVVDQALLELCLVVIEDCSKSLHSSIPLMVETMVVLCRSPDSTKAHAALHHLMISRHEIGEILSVKFFTWSQALPRIMQGNDDRPKQQMLGQIATSFIALADNMSVSEDATVRISSVLVDSVSAALDVDPTRSSVIDESPSVTLNELVQSPGVSGSEFEPLLLSHQSQKASTEELRNLVSSLKSHPGVEKIVHNIIEQSRDPNTHRSLSATWLALAFLAPNGNEHFDLSYYVEERGSDDYVSLSRPFLISELYAQTLPHLLQHADLEVRLSGDWRPVALALESLVIQADQLGESYRPELMETLFPLLSLFGSPNAKLQKHAMTSLNLLAKACNYNSATQMLIENVDYLINAIALRLNSFDISQESLQVLAMMVQLCGAALLPHLDDVITSIFAALDSYHGYPKLVEYLFAALGMVVDESAKHPMILAIKPDMRERASHEQRTKEPARLGDIVNDLRTRRTRHSMNDKQHEILTAAPNKPWISELDGPEDSPTNEDAEEDNGEDSMPLDDSGETKEAGLTTSHQLLLRIAESTVPHMSSPSAKVRLTLLELLRKISPLLARDENSFLPLVNAIWPAIVSRLLIQKHQDTQELSYNILAAIETIRVVCESAGDFMATRIDEIFVDLEMIFKRLHSTVTRSTSKNALKPSLVSHNFSVATRAAQSSMPDQRGVLDQSDTWHQTKTSNAHILESLVNLLRDILQFVRISEDNADKIFEMLGPFIQKDGKQPLREVLNQYNSDGIWLIDQRLSE